MTPPPQIELARELSEQLTIHKNIGQEIVVTTVDKMKICLMETRDSLTAQREWIAPLALLVSLTTSLLAADFRDFVVSQAVWEALYIMASIGAAAWLVKAALRAFRGRGRGSLDHIVERLKKDSSPTEGLISLTGQAA